MVDGLESAQPPAWLPDHLRLTAVEELWGIPIGPDVQTSPLSPSVPATGPREALEDVVGVALRRPPCMVSFSGGVDSSAVLALAVHVARRDGLPLPVPVTNCFPSLAEAAETQWQEQVMDHLELDDWVRLDWCDELDMLGPVATRVLARHGILVPFNSHFHYPLLELAAGGSLLTGFGGDELFGRVERVALADVMFSPRRLRVGELPSLVIDIAPRPVRTLVRGLRRPYRHFSWIRLPALASLGWADTSWDMREPVRWDRSVCEWWWPARMLQCCLASMRVMAADFDVHVASPLASSVVLAAFAQAGGAVGLRSRSPALRGILGDLLPETVLSRATKASFGGAFWSRHARDFVARWDGRGIDQTRVSAAALRKEWALPSPDAHSFVQLQRAWMASRPCTAGK